MMSPGDLVRIDFHIGQAHDSGIGVEFAMPASDTEITRALVRLNDLNTHYAGRLIVALILDHLDPPQRGDVLN